VNISTFTNLTIINMLKNSQTKAIVVVVLIVALVSGGLLVVKNIQDNQALQNSEAAGFGSSATRDNFANVENDFAASSCEYFFSKGLINSDQKDLYSLVDNINTKAYPAETRVPKVCDYDLGNGKKISFGVFTYAANSKIDATQSDLFSRIYSANLSSTIIGGQLTNIHYFFGNNLNVGGMCSSLVFHDQNDFEYAIVNYEGFGDCTNLKAVNNEVLQIFSKKILDIMRKYPYNF